MTRKFFVLGILLVVMLVLAACGTPAKPAYDADEIVAEAQETVSASDEDAADEDAADEDVADKDAADEDAADEDAADEDAADEDAADEDAADEDAADEDAADEDAADEDATDEDAADEDAADEDAADEDAADEDAADEDAADEDAADEDAADEDATDEDAADEDAADEDAADEDAADEDAADEDAAIGADDPLFEAVSAADPANGEQLFTMQACLGCHTTDSSGMALVGPGQWNLIYRAGERVEGQGPYTYMYNSIVHPNDYVVEGFVENLMPTHFGDVLSDEEIYDIIAYMATLAD